MRINSGYFLLLALLLSAGTTCLYAQDAGSPSFENYDTDPIRDRVTTPAESATPRSIPAASRDSIAARSLQRNNFKPAAPVVPKDGKSRNPADDSILSFNFLYYLIQKYKMQDILD